MKDSNDSTNNTGKVLTALLLGAAAGAVAALLFAPEEGSKTRKKISKKAKEIADDVKTRVNKETENLRSKSDKYADQAEERVQDMANSVKQSTEAIKNRN